MSNATYTCRAGTDPTCPVECVSLGVCEQCGCVVADKGGGPWGDAADVILCLLPIAFLLAVTLKPNPLPTTVSLPSAAIMMFLIRVMYLASDPLLVSACVIKGVHEALSPLTIMFGAIFLFETMEATLCMPYMMREMKALTKGHPVAELMILYCFAYMVEGASGFGTPAALGAPMLASLGYPKLQACVTLLLMNTFATVWGAAGTPIWFGFGNLGLTEDDFVEISYKAGVALIIAAFLVLPTMVLTIACPWRVLHKNALFLVLSMITVHGPSFGISFFSFEFPSLIGGMVGCFLTAGLIQFRVGLRDYVPPVEGDHARDPLAIDTISDNHSIVSSHRKRKQQEKDEKSKVNGDSHVVPIASLQSVPEEVSAQFSRGFKQQQSSISAASEGPDEEEAGLDEEEEEEEDKEDLKLFIEECLGPRKSIKEGYIRELFGRTFPLWGTVVLLVITRLPQIPVKGWLTQQEPAFTIFFGTYGVFRCSASLVLQLRDILTYPNLNWKYELLYIPFIMPFVIVSGITMIIYRKDLQAKPHEILCTVAGRLYNPAIALMGALVLVQLMINSGKAAPANIIGVVLSDALKGGFIAISAFLGALGSFFSGSTTVSNLTFGAIQLIAAQNIGTSETAMLALQAAGGSAGNGICLNNIIAVCAVVGLNIGEGQIIMRTGLPVFCFCVIATIVMVALFMRFE